MPTFQVKDMVNGVPTFEKPLDKILATLSRGGAIKTLSPVEYITHQQIAWFKGILLPALAKDSGDSVAYWETKLKLAVLPDDFQPFYVPMGKQIFPVIPSITILSKKKMNLLIKGSVDTCHDWGFDWITEPDKELRKKWNWEKSINERKKEDGKDRKSIEE